MNPIIKHLFLFISIAFTIIGCNKNDSPTYTPKEYTDGFFYIARPSNGLDPCQLNFYKNNGTLIKNIFENVNGISLNSLTTDIFKAEEFYYLHSSKIDGNESIIYKIDSRTLKIIHSQSIINTANGTIANKYININSNKSLFYLNNSAPAIIHNYTLSKKNISSKVDFKSASLSIRKLNATKKHFYLTSYIYDSISQLINGFSILDVTSDSIIRFIPSENLLDFANDDKGNLWLLKSGTYLTFEKYNFETNKIVETRIFKNAPLSTRFASDIENGKCMMAGNYFLNFNDTLDVPVMLASTWPCSKNPYNGNYVSKTVDFIKIYKNDANTIIDSFKNYDSYFGTYTNPMLFVK
jgi:hypothetical protein